MRTKASSITLGFRFVLDRILHQRCTRCGGERVPPFRPFRRSNSPLSFRGRGCTSRGWSGLLLAVPVCGFLHDDDISYWNDVLEEQFRVAYDCWQKKMHGKSINPSEKRQVPVDWQVIHDKIHRLVSNNRVVVFMKGSPDNPKCRYSKKVVYLLRSNGIEHFTYIDVSNTIVLKEGVKRYSDWPTLPQVYVDGRLIGGVDVLESIHERKMFQQVMADPTIVAGEAKETKPERKADHD